ncbi:TolC family protein [Salidesulfovibrio onnuriiensis]|uniref:TolC family protein n=1 Tax=Salidesulfovibrio onnuriiensis TaxID=2583823 RepID=UPI0011C93CAD|nr:TolC family protein [Salidesulfovibrio onnuriiensis]
MKMEKYLKSFVLAVLFAMVAGATFAADDQTVPQADLSKPFDMQACVERALEANPAIIGARAALKGEGYGVNSAMGEFGFKATSGYGYTHYNREPTYGDKDQFYGTVGLSQPLFKGFNLLSSYQKAKLSEDKSNYSLYNTELNVIKDVQSNFLKLLKGRMDVKSGEDSVERLESQLKVINAFYEVGLKPRVEVLQAEVDLATAKQELLTSQNAVSTQRAKLNSLLNIPLEENVDYIGQLDYLPFDLQLKDCLDKAYKERPDLNMGVKSVEIAVKDAMIAASSFYPEITADFDYYKKGNNGDLKGGDNWTESAAEYWTAGVNLNWTMFEWGADYNDWKQTKETIKQLQAELENTKLNAGFEVKQALLDLRAAADRIGVGRKSVESARESYRMAVARYQAQVGTNTEVLDAQARVSDSEAQLNSALADYNTALSQLYVAMGEKNLDLKSR